MRETTEHHPTLRLVRYALPSLISSVATLPLVLFVPAFYATDLGVPLPAVGAALAASRLLDVVTDPLIGIASDRLETRWGRRKPWIVLGTPLFMLALWQVFVPGPSATALGLFGWSALLFLGFTLIEIPHKAWGAELSSDYDERSRITSWREALAAAGQVTLLAALVYWGSRGVVDAPDQLGPIAVVVVAALPVLVFIAVRTVPEGRRERYPHGTRPFLASLGLVVRNPAFGRMIGCVVFFVSGIAMQGTLHRMVLTDVMQDERRFPAMLLIENIATLVLVPLWLWVSIRIGKHRALIAAALWLAAFSVPLGVLRAGNTVELIAVIAIRGSSFASMLFLANSIAADVIDLDTLESGEQRSGLYFAVWGMTTKLALALGVVLGTALPAAFGYQPTATPSPAVASRLMMLYGPLAALMMATGALFLWRFPVTRTRHAQIQAELARRTVLPAG